MAENKTKPEDTDPAAFIAGVEPAAKREDAKVLDALFRRVTGEAPVMWGPAIVGYGRYHYRYESGREGDWMRTGFSPKKAKHSIYLTGGYCDEATAARNDALLAKLGKHTTGASCLYINKLADVDMAVLEELVRLNWQAMNALYPPEN